MIGHQGVAGHGDGCSLPRPVFHEPLGCCLAASHLSAPLMTASVLLVDDDVVLGDVAFEGFGFGRGGGGGVCGEGGGFEREGS